MTSRLVRTTLLSTSLFLLYSCGEEDTLECPSLDTRPQTARSGSVDFDFGSSATATFPDPARGFAATTGMSAPYVVPPSGSPVNADESVVAEWTAGPNGLIAAVVAVGDLRDWGVGEPELPGIGSVFVSYDDPGCATSGCCTATGGEATVEVLEATGGELPWPDVVSDDFRRVFRIEASANDAPGVRRADDGSQVACATEVSIEIDLEFEITADHFVARPNQRCPR